MFCKCVFVIVVIVVIVFIVIVVIVVNVVIVVIVVVSHQLGRHGHASVCLWQVELQYCSTMFVVVKVIKRSLYFVQRSTVLFAKR